MNIISNDGSNKLNRSRKARVSYKVQRTINASLNAATSTRAVSSNPNFVTRQKIEIPLPPETELSRQMTTSTTSIDIMGLQAAYANLHTDQERDYFMQRYHDVISSFGGKTSYDADNRPLLVMRSNLWASGYDVDGTDQTSLGQFSGRVQQTY